MPDTEYDAQYDGSINHSKNADGQLVVDLYDANDGKIPRNGGPYQDQIVKEQAEVIRAKKEDREPDLDSPPAVAATQLVTAKELVERDTDKSHYGDTLAITNEPVASVLVDNTSGFDGEPDLTQPNFDNDMTKVNVLRAGNEFDQLTKDAPEPVKSETSNTPVSIEDEFARTTDKPKSEDV